VPSAAWRATASAFGFTLLIGTTLWALDRLAHREFTIHLRDQAAHALALAARGATPYQWRFHTPDDIVAGHPFGNATFAFADGTLQIRGTHDPFEIGLPLARPVDLKRFPQLRIAFEAESPGEVRVITRTRLESSENVSAPITFGTGRQELAQDIGSLAGPPAIPPETARLRGSAMLRLRFSLAAPGTVSLHDISLHRSTSETPLDINRSPRVVEPGTTASAGNIDVFRLPYSAQKRQTDIAFIAAYPRDGEPPLVLLPERGRVEQQIALRDAVYAALPAAILIPESAFDQTFELARALAARPPAAVPASTRWHFAALFACLLALARLLPPRNARGRALLEIFLTLAVPMWLIAGGEVNSRVTQQALIVLTLAYAVSLGWPRTWRLNGGTRAWAWAGAVVALTLLIGIALHGSGSHAPVPGIGHVARYVAWALLQQYLICAVCTERWLVVTGSNALAVYLGALAFALLHTPNAALMAATFVGGLCWCAIYLRYRALLPLAVSHAASALLLGVLLPADIVRSAEVSARFFQ